MSEQPRLLRLEGDVTLRTVKSHQAALRDLLATGGPVTLEASGVQSCDIAGLQLLLSASQTAAAAGTTLSLAAAADGPIARTLRESGLLAADGTSSSPLIDTWSFTSEAA